MRTAALLYSASFPFLVAITSCAATQGPAHPQRHAITALHGPPSDPSSDPVRPLLEGDHADALLEAWFGCAMGDTWTGALDTPPHSWAAHVLDRCHAVGLVTGPPAVHLAVMVPEAVCAVRMALWRRIEADDSLTPAEAEAARELFDQGTGALAELADSLRGAALLSRPVPTKPSPKTWLPPSDVTPQDLATAHRRLVDVTRLSSLFRFAENVPAKHAADRAIALAWMIGVHRMAYASELGPALRAEMLEPVLAALFPLVGDPGYATPPPDPRDAEAYWSWFVTGAASRILDVGWLPTDDSFADRDVMRWSAEQAYEALLRKGSQALGRAATPLPPSELRRAVAGYAEALRRDHVPVTRLRADREGPTKEF